MQHSLCAQINGYGFYKSRTTYRISMNSQVHCTAAVNISQRHIVEFLSQATNMLVDSCHKGVDRITQNPIKLQRIKERFCVPLRKISPIYIGAHSFI